MYWCDNVADLTGDTIAFLVVPGIPYVITLILVMRHVYKHCSFNDKLYILLLWILLGATITYLPNLEFLFGPTIYNLMNH